MCSGELSLAVCWGSILMSCCCGTGPPLFEHLCAAPAGACLFACMWRMCPALLGMLLNWSSGFGIVQLLTWLPAVGCSTCAASTHTSLRRSWATSRASWCRCGGKRLLQPEWQSGIGWLPRMGAAAARCWRQPLRACLVGIAAPHVPCTHAALSLQPLP